MLPRSVIPILLAGAMLLALPAGSVRAATESSRKSSTAAKKKSGTATKKKPATADADAGTSTPKKGTDLDLPLPSKTPGATGSTELKSTPAPRKNASTEKAGDVPAKSGSTAGKNGASAEKTAAEKEKKQVEETPAEDKPAGTKAVDPTAKRERPPNATVEPEAIAEFPAQPPRIQQLMREAIDLTRRDLTYTFGSAEPDKGGMDCSGTIYYLLHANGFSEAPRDSAGQYLWARKSGAFFPVVSTSADGPEFNELRPGDLMFWTGTYQTQRDVPISHVMLYLGREKGSGKRIMFGASDGRSYNGIQRWGVSVFDFKMPKVDPANPEKAKVDFVGYARIPGLRNAAETVAASAIAEEPAKGVEKPTSSDELGSSPTAKSEAAEDGDKPRAKNSAAEGTAKKSAQSSSSGAKKKKGTSTTRK